MEHKSLTNLRESLAGLFRSSGNSKFVTEDEYILLVLAGEITTASDDYPPAQMSENKWIFIKDAT